MINQGDIIKINLNPTRGHEQSGLRPALVVSNNYFNTKTRLLLICPITNTDNGFPTNVKLKDTTTTGVVKCEHIRAIDPTAREHTFIEPVSKNILQEVIDIVYGSVENIEV